MTEGKAPHSPHPSPLSPVQQKFILHWGEMGTRWGINRTVAQVHALLYMSPRPLHADEIVDTLAVARSNVSTSLKELQGWGIVRRVHVIGDKRDHFESLEDAHADKATDEYTEERLRELHQFFTTTTAWYARVRQWPTSTLVKFMKASDRMLKAVGIGG